MRLAVHNAVQLTDEQVRSRFVVRSHELDELLAHLHDDGPPRHALVIGPRGIGKSLLLRRIAVAVADDPDLRCRWLPVVMPEELYEVTSVGELWLAALERLAEAEQDAALAEQHAALLKERDPSRMATLALERLLGAARARGRKVLLLAENLDMVFDEQVESDDTWTLRQALQTENDLLLMASAVTTFAQVEHEGEAFYGFFHRIDLRPLDDDDVRTMWATITTIELSPRRAAPIRIVTGGNPRLVTVLAQFARQPTVRGLRESIELLVDDYTPYFKANIEALAPKERKVFITLADIWSPATTAEIAARARMGTSAVSSLLIRLMGRGAVEVIGEGRGKARYQVSERFYNLYHQLRRANEDGRVRALVDLLAALYEPAELDRDVLPHLLPADDLGEPPSAIDAAVAARLWRDLNESGIYEQMSPPEIAERLPTIESILAKQRATRGDAHPDTLRTSEQVALLAERAGDPRRAVRAFESLAAIRSASLGPDHPDTLRSRHSAAYYTGLTGDSHTALDLHRTVVADREHILGPDHYDTLASRHEVAYVTGLTGDWHTALDLNRTLVADRDRVLGPHHPDTLRSRHNAVHCIGQAGDWPTAVDLFRTLVADEERILGPNHPDTLTSRAQIAYSTGRTGDWHAALDLNRAVAADRERVLGPDHPDTFRSRHNAAYSTGQTGDWLTAFNLFRGLVADHERVLGPDHPDTLFTRYNEANCAGQTGDWHTALDLHRAVAADHERVLGPEHAETLRSRIGIARCTAETGDLRAAAALATALADDAERALPENSPVLREVRALRARLDARLLAESGQPLPRELAEALAADAERRQ
jgi:hypothetical protein